MEVCELFEEKETLHWSYRTYEELPEELESAVHLEDLYMKRNRLKKLPKWIGKLVNLSILQLHGNDLKSIPQEIGLLSNLHKLDLGCNKLTSLPIEIKSLRNLHELNAENNKLTSIPKEIGSLTALYLLNLSRNELTHLPNTIGCCTSLQELQAESNKLFSIPSNVVYLSNLSSIRLENNKLLYFPAITFVSSPFIGCLNNRTLNYISYEVYLHLIDILHFKYNYRSNFTCGDIASDNSSYMFLPNIVIEFTFNGKKRVIILPDSLQNVLEDTQNLNHIPSLREMLLSTIYKNTPSENKSIYYYKTNDNYLPKKIKELFINGPTARCLNCKTFIFTECIIWIVPRLLNCTICLESDILTVVYFCSKRCTDLYRKAEDAGDYYLSNITSYMINWTRIK